jgi:PAS domain S-box-containing protein
MKNAKTLPSDKEIDNLKSDIAALLALQQEKDRLQQDYDNSQSRFKAIFERSAYGNKFINSDLEIIKVNSALVKLLGYSKKELLGTRITDIAHPDYVSHWQKLQHNLWTAKRSCFSLETCLIKKDKTPFFCHVTSILLTDNGETLGYSILEDISHRKALEQNLKVANSRELLLQHQLLEATIEAQENEKLHIADDVHNSLAQLLYGVRLGLSQIDLGQSSAENSLAFKDAKDLLHDCIKECRRISYNLRPSVLEQFGIKAAIEDMCKEISGSTNFKCSFAGLHGRLPKLLEVTIYRMVQELATNVIKHSSASKASIKLSINRKNIEMVVEDDGVGFTASNIKDGIGIRSIENKVHLLKGKLDVSSSPGAGTTMNIQFSSKTF